MPKGLQSETVNWRKKQKDKQWSAEHCTKN